MPSPNLSRKYIYRRRRQSLLINVQYDFSMLKRIAWRKACTTIASSEKMCRSRSDTAHFAHDELERNLFNIAHAFQCYSFFFFWRHFAGQLCLSSSTSKNSWLTIYVLMKQDNQELLRNLLLIYITTCLTYSSLIKCKKSNWNYANVVISFPSF